MAVMRSACLVPIIGIMRTILHQLVYRAIAPNSRGNLRPGRRRVTSESLFVCLLSDEQKVWKSSVPYQYRSVKR